MLLFTIIIYWTQLLCVTSVTKNFVLKINVLKYRALDLSEIGKYKTSRYYFSFCACTSRVHNPDKSVNCRCSDKRQGRSVLESLPTATFSTDCFDGSASRNCLTAVIQPIYRNDVLYVKIAVDNVTVTYPTHQQIPISTKKRYIQLNCPKNRFVCRNCSFYCKHGYVDMVYIVKQYHEPIRKPKFIKQLNNRHVVNPVIKQRLVTPVRNNQKTLYSTEYNLSSINNIKQYLLEKATKNPMSESNFSIARLKDELTKYHNVYRRLHGAVSLDYDIAIEAYAQKWSDKLASKLSCIQHDTFKRYGENIFFYAATVLPNESILARMTIHSFYIESNGYNYTTHNNMDYHTRGHFTQLIWKDTRRLGIGVSIKYWPNRYADKCMPRFPASVVYVVIKYDPPGNVHELTYYSQNVLPAQQASSNLLVN